MFQKVIPAMAGLCAIAIFSFPAAGLAAELTNASSAQAVPYSYSSTEPAPEPSQSIAARARRLFKGEDGPLMYCDQFGYKCTPNSAYYGNSEYNYQPVPYYEYADGFTNYSFPNVPQMGGF